MSSRQAQEGPKPPLAPHSNGAESKKVRWDDENASSSKNISSDGTIPVRQAQQKTGNVSSSDAATSVPTPASTRPGTGSASAQASENPQAQAATDLQEPLTGWHLHYSSNPMYSVNSPGYQGYCHTFYPQVNNLLSCLRITLFCRASHLACIPFPSFINTNPIPFTHRDNVVPKHGAAPRRPSLPASCP